MLAIKLTVNLLVVFFCSDFRFVVEPSSMFHHNVNNLIYICVCDGPVMSSVTLSVYLDF